MDRRYYSVAQVAATLSVSPATVYRLVGSQALASVRVGKAVRIPRSSVERYLDVCARPQLELKPPVRKRPSCALTTQDPEQLCDWSAWEQLDEKMRRRKGLANV